MWCRGFINSVAIQRRRQRSVNVQQHVPRRRRRQIARNRPPLRRRGPRLLQRHLTRIPPAFRSLIHPSRRPVPRAAADLRRAQRSRNRVPEEPSVSRATQRTAACRRAVSGRSASTQMRAISPVAAAPDAADQLAPPSRDASTRPSAVPAYARPAVCAAAVTFPPLAAAKASRSPASGSGPFTADQRPLVSCATVPPCSSTRRRSNSLRTSRPGNSSFIPCQESPPSSDRQTPLLPAAVTSSAFEGETASDLSPPPMIDSPPSPVRFAHVAPVARNINIVRRRGAHAVDGSHQCRTAFRQDPGRRQGRRVQPPVCHVGGFKHAARRRPRQQSSAPVPDVGDLHCRGARQTRVYRGRPHPVPRGRGLRRR